MTGSTGAEAGATLQSLSAAMRALESFLDQQRPGWHQDEKLAAGARAISETYTEGGEIGPDLAASHAYLAYFGPRAIAAVSHGLRGIRVSGTVVDVGAGSGAASLAALAAGATRAVLIERSQPALARARALLGDRALVRPSFVADAEPLRDATLLVCAFAYGELPQENAFQSLARLVPPSARMLIVDAGDHAHARTLQELRDVLRTGDRPILAPCPHHDICPALVRERDWCHEVIDKHLTDKLASFARLVGRDDQHMATFALALGAVGEQHDQRDELLVIGDARKEKGRARLPVCGPRGLRFLQSLKRNRAAHDALLDVERGARLSVPKEIEGDTAHLTEPPT